MFDLKRFFSGKNDDYIPVATDLPRELHPRDTKADTAALGAASATAVGLVNGPMDGAVAGGITAMSHRVATSAAWDEYDKMRAEADEALRQRQPLKGDS